MKNLKFDKKHVLIYFAIVVVFCILVYFLYQSFSAGNSNADKPDDIVVNQELKIDLVEYDVYQLEELNFRFIIAKLRLQSDEDFDLTLDGFVSSENIALGSVDSYLTAMVEKSLFVGKKDVDFEIKGEAGDLLLNLFIPIRNNSLQTLDLRLPTAEDNVINFDLKENVITESSSLVYEADDVITDGSSYELTVSSAFEITGEVLYNNGVEESYPSTAQLHAFYLDVSAIGTEKLIIEDAKYVVSGSGDEFVALDKNYMTEKRSGILGKEITAAGSGCLFFMTLNPEHQPISYQGDLYIKIAGIDYWIKVQVDL